MSKTGNRKNKRQTITPEQGDFLEGVLDLVNGVKPRGQYSYTLSMIDAETLNIIRAIIEPLPYRHLPVDDRPDNIDYADRSSISLQSRLRLLRSLLDALESDELGSVESRIRRCLHCERYFYAWRRNKRVCSDACGNVRRVQKSRAKHSETAAEYAVHPGKVATKSAAYKRAQRKAAKELRQGAKQKNARKNRTNSNKNS